MANEIIEKITELGTTWDQFKKDNEARLKALETKGHADPVLIEKVDKMASSLAAIDEQKDRIEQQAKTVAELKAKADAMEERLNTPVFLKDGTSIVPKELHEKTLHWLRTGDPATREEVNAKCVQLQKSLNLSEVGDGGVFYSVIKESGVMQLVRETTPMRQVATVRTIGGSSWVGRKKTGNSSGGWVGELEDRDETTAPTYAEKEIVAQEMYAEPWVSNKILQDADYDIEGDLNMDLAETFSELENTAFISGNGVKKPRGILSYTAATSPSGEQVLYVPTGASGDWAASTPWTVLLGLGEKLKAQYAANSVFLMSRDRLAEVMKWIDGNNLPVWQPSLQAGVPSLLAGYPVLKAPDMPAKAANSLSVAFGDFGRAYRIIDRLGMTMLRDPFTAKQYTKMYTTKRTGGDVVDHNAYLVLKFASS